MKAILSVALLLITFSNFLTANKDLRCRPCSNSNSDFKPCSKDKPNKDMIECGDYSVISDDKLKPPDGKYMCGIEINEVTGEVIERHCYPKLDQPVGWNKDQNIFFCDTPLCNGIEPDFSTRDLSLRSDERRCYNCGDPDWKYPMCKETNNGRISKCNPGEICIKVIEPKNRGVTFRGCYKNSPKQSSHCTETGLNEYKTLEKKCYCDSDWCNDGPSKEDPIDDAAGFKFSKTGITGGKGKDGHYKAVEGGHSSDENGGGENTSTSGSKEICAIALLIGLSLLL